MILLVLIVCFCSSPSSLEKPARDHRLDLVVEQFHVPLLQRRKPSHLAERGLNLQGAGCLWLTLRFEISINMSHGKHWSLTLLLTEWAPRLVFLVLYIIGWSDSLCMTTDHYPLIIHDCNMTLVTINHSCDNHEHKHWWFIVIDACYIITGNV